MGKLEKLIREYMSETVMLQLATSRDNQPWCCTVYYAYDSALNLYFTSQLIRRHSVEIKDNNKIAGAIVKPHTPGDQVRGLSFEGFATHTEHTNPVFEQSFRYYAERFDWDEEETREVLSGKSKHKLYTIKPTSIILFDQVNFPDGPRQELKLTPKE